MFRVESIHISGFWGKYEVGTPLHEDVNIFIGQNGSGKTTFMNILHAVLSVDPEGLSENDFTEVLVRLTDGEKRRTVKAIKVEAGVEGPFPTINYSISRNKYVMVLPGTDDMRPTPWRRRAMEQAGAIRSVLSESILLSSLSVYRFRMDPDADLRERGRTAMSPVDARLQYLQNQLTQYQFELSDEARKISSALQKKVLMSLLYAQEDENATDTLSAGDNIERERARLVHAYKQLGLSGSDVSARIQKHASAVSDAVKLLKAGQNAPAEVLDTQIRLNKIVEMSLDAEQRVKQVFAQVTLFLSLLADFVTNKIFAFENGELVAHGFPDEASRKAGRKGNPIHISKLSSGEKQLLILLVEALLQKQNPYVYLADEPELSLHITWQQLIIAAIRRLNPNSQIIVATHSPEIAGRFQDKLIDMEDILNGQA